MSGYFADAALSNIGNEGNSDPTSIPVNGNNLTCKWKMKWKIENTFVGGCRKSRKGERKRKIRLCKSKSYLFLRNFWHLETIEGQKKMIFGRLGRVRSSKWPNFSNESHARTALKKCYFKRQTTVHAAEWRLWVLGKIGPSYFTRTLICHIQISPVVGVLACFLHNCSNAQSSNLLPLPGIKRA